jgi:dihydroxy-acid dehydratase
MTMGTASTMASLVEALGLSLPYNAALPAVDGRRRSLAHMSGHAIVKLVRENIRMSAILPRQSFENAIRVHAAIGGSTNAILHLLALAGRLGVSLALEDFDRLGHGVPLIADVMPSGRFLMEEFCYAGGIPAVLRELGALINQNCLTVCGKTIADIMDAAECTNRDVIHAMAEPVCPTSGVWVLRGNLCPQGAIIKPSAASASLLSHRGRAVVFESIEDYKARIDDPALEVNAQSILVLKGCGPKGYPGMPEVGNMALPRKLLEKGVRDMVRISDARMSGTAFGSVVLHVAPEAAAGGTLALVHNGDEIVLDGPNRRLDLLVDEEELAIRRQHLEVSRYQPSYSRGWAKLYCDTVQQADRGCDLDFLVGASGDVVERESH